MDERDRAALLGTGAGALILQCRVALIAGDAARAERESRKRIAPTGGDCGRIERRQGAFGGPAAVVDRHYGQYALQRQGRVVDRQRAAGLA
ncbi:hypothetical protein D3C72_2312790 [compost metagenome]